MAPNIDANKTKIKELLAGSERGVKLFTALEATDFFTAPASSRHHLNCAGGLAQHSLNVYNTLRNLDGIFPLKNGPTAESWLIVGIGHDVCKINNYIPKILKSGKVSEAEPWTTKADLFPAGHGEKSVFLLQMWGIPLSEREILMIRWHMGFYDYSFKEKSDALQKTCPEVILMFCADWLTSMFESLADNNLNE